MIPPLRRSLQPLPRATISCKSQVLHRRYFQGAGPSQAASSSRPPRSRKTAFIASATIGAALLYYLYPSQAQSSAPPARAQVKFEEPRKKARTSEENRDLISPQHLQVKDSWEHPGVYAWGSNVGRVVAPDSNDTIIKKPRRIAYFDGKLLRDIKLDKFFGAAISESGDLIQWGTGFSSTSQGPTSTLEGKDLVKITISRDRIIALSSNGTIYSVSAPQAGNESGSKPQKPSWFQVWKSTPTTSTSYRKLRPANLAWGEKVTDISSGLDHCLLLTSAGRVFSAATGTDTYPSKGQFGIPDSALTNNLTEPYDQPHEINTLRGSKISRIATGDYHSLVLDTEGKIYSFGDNSSGQLGLQYRTEATAVDKPTLLPIDKVYNDSNIAPRVTNIAAGGASSFFTVDAARIPAQSEDDPQGLSRTTADTWACGQGIAGALGNGRWTHIQDTPTKIKALSGLREYDEIKKLVVPIRLSRLSVGSTHVSAVLDNVTSLSTNLRRSKNDTNWGSDVLWWGGNEFYQLGTGKRNNVNNPTYIPPIDIEGNNIARDGEQRFQLTPRKKIPVGRRKVSVEQRIECGRGVTAVYSGT